MTGGYRLGAVVYHTNVRRIWEAFGAWFGERGLALEPRYYERYEDQVAGLLTGKLDTAWNTNLAHVQVLRATHGNADALAMRDTDRGWRSLLVAREDSGLRTLEDLRGRRIGCGDADSPQAHIMPVHALRAEGFDPRGDCVATRLDRDVGKHGDTGASELAQLARVRPGELDACVVSGLTLDGVRRLRDSGGVRELWASPPFHHCCFTVVGGDERHARFRELLLSMDIADPNLCEPMELEHVNRWLAFDASGYRELMAAVQAGPVIVGGSDRSAA
jgi:phosphonate transport system substrate-binding protein